MNRRKFLEASTAALLVAGCGGSDDDPALSLGEDGMMLTIGQLIPLPTTYAPANTVACNGQLLPISRYPALNDLLGTTYGGDGIGTFGVPNVPPLQPLNGPPIHWYMPYVGIYGGSAQSGMPLFGQAGPLIAAANGTTPCTGGLQAINGNNISAALFSLLGTQFGGDGLTTFGYPNVPPMPINATQSFPYYLQVAGLYPTTTCNAVKPIDGGASGNGDFLLGSIGLFPYLPALMDKLCGFALCRGQLIELEGNRQWDKLFSILGTRYGGDGKKTFGLPNLPDGPGGLTYAMSINGAFPSPA